MNRIRTYIALCRTGIALFASGSAATARLLAGAPVSTDLLLLAAGLFLLACGASGLNQFQERDIDGRMERTRGRPLPSGALAPRSALLFSLLLIASGLLVLGSSGPAAPALGMLALAWYNGLYTPLKRRTAFAAVYGALVGVIPPAIGWTSGNGNIGDPRFFALAVLFLLWQVPHFWLLLLRREADYRAAGLPVLTNVIGAARLSRITLLWTLAAAATPLLLPLFGIVRSPVVVWLLLPVALLAAAAAVAAFRRPAAGFRWINAFLAALLLLLSLDPLLH